MSAQPFTLDGPALHRALDVKRRREHLSWRAIGRNLGISQSTFSRLRDGGVSITADSFIVLMVWLDLDTDIIPFIAPREP